jgi:hypothetical protein
MRRIVFFVFMSSFCATSLFSQTNDSTSFYNSIHYKGSAQIEIDEQTYHCQFNFVNVIDSFFYIQLNMGPLEAGRVLATPSSILLINKLQKNYYEGDYSFFYHLIDLDIDFYALQAIFNGIPVSVSEDITLSYSGKSIFDDPAFFNKLTCKNDDFVLKLEIKKITFHDVPKVSATVPKNYLRLSFCNEE